MERIWSEMRKECSKRSILTGKKGLLRHTKMRDKIFSHYVLSKVFLTSNHPYFLSALTPL